ncbi:MAG: hypothetical protein HWN81_19565 [Candidatus Lokiarchaeota archaeon]|nr:hypothetical protein [Candidatus Lokiarchaeota archaeon]
MKYKYRNLFILIFLLLITLNAIPSVLGKTRQSYLTSFVKKNEIENRGFSNAFSSEDIVSFEATTYALEILEDYGINPNEIEALQNNLENDIGEMFDENKVNLYDLFYLMKSLNILQYEIDTDLENRIYQYLNDTEQIGGGFSFSNTSSSASLASTYYIVQLYSLINESIGNLLVHKNWVLSCNNIDGGYGGNQSLSSTLPNTYFTTLIFDELWEINDLVNINKTLSYLNSFYINDSSDLDSFGGYLPDENAQYATLSSSYFCVKAISLIDTAELNGGSTISWVLNHQNFEDGGFSDNIVELEQKKSSIIASYYAFETLKILNPSLSSLAKEIWTVEFNYWILGIVFISIGVIIAVIVFIWRKRRI